MFVLLAFLSLSGCSAAYADEPLEECACPPDGPELVVEEIECEDDLVQISLSPEIVPVSILDCSGGGNCRNVPDFTITDGRLRAPCDLIYARFTYLLVP